VSVGASPSKPSSRSVALSRKLLHDRPEVRQELIERLLAPPDVEDLKLAIFTEA